MDVDTCIKTRRSVRKFKSDPIPKDVLESVITAASYAPSWKNSQTTRYIAVTDEETKHQLALECCGEHNRDIIDSAPLVVATLIIAGRSGYERDGSYSTVRQDAWQSFDNGIATQTLCLSAWDKGLGTVIMGLYDIDRASQILRVEDGKLLMALVAMGYPDEEPDVPKKKDVSQLLEYR